MTKLNERITVQILTSLDELLRLGDEWDGAYHAAASSPYLYFDWVVSHISCHGADDGMFIAIVRESGVIITILPLQLSHRFGARQLQALGGGQAPTYTAIILEQARQYPLLELIGEAISRHTHWDWMVLDRIPHNSPLLENRRKIKVTDLGESVTVHLGSSWDDYVATLSKSHRKTIRRRCNKFEKTYSVKMKRFSLLPQDESAEDLEQLLEDALAVCRKSWQGSADWGVAICEPGEVEFFKTSSHAMAKHGMLELSVLYADEKPVSFIWGAADCPVFASATTAFDPEFTKMSPGAVHHFLLFESLTESGFTTVELGHEFTSHKRLWSKHGVPVCAITYYNNPLIGPLKQKVMARIERLVRSCINRLRRC